MSAGAEVGAVPYQEPSIVTILTQSSFVLALNAINFAFDRAIYCGVIGQILTGMAWGTPGADILGSDFQRTITDLGYLGLILIVFEGGLSTNMRALRSNIVLSAFVALTGITLPIALSFVLIKMCNATTLQSFAAGCALSSTSLGTTFTILKANGLDKSRLGTVLISAAMLDDVVGLVLVQVISNLGALEGGGFSAITIIRPVFVSIGYAALVPVLLYLFNILGLKVHISSSAASKIATVLSPDQIRVARYTGILIAAVTSASYAGTSNLFAAYLAGFLISSGRQYKSGWHKTRKALENKSARGNPSQGADSPELPAPNDTNESWELVAANRDTAEHKDIFSEDPKPSTTHPQSNLPKASNLPEARSTEASTQTTSTSSPEPDANIYDKYYATVVNKLLKGFFFGSIGFSIPISRLFDGPTLWRGIIYSILMALGKLACGIWLVRFTTCRPPSPPANPPSNKGSKIWTNLLQYRPQSLYPAGILGNAMVARGEIGFLISAIAQSNGIFDSSGDKGKGDLFLIVTWAILLCTVVGPISVGLLTRRVKRLRREVDGGCGGRADPLGVWADL